MASPDTDSKPALRRVLRASLPDALSQLAQSIEIRQVLHDWLSHRAERVISAFSAIPGEPQLLPLLSELKDRRWVLPRIEGDSLHFHFVDHTQTELETGPFGITEPSAIAPLCPTDGVQIFLCPGLGFTPCGKRLGRGKGFYDRSLAQSDSESIRVGVCFREQVHPHLLVDPHDMPMHFLATPDGVKECR
ncbi:5-formyltetrahydrofolate cyclo-ligase [Haloferula sp. BvORR071]|uniref:5-formyltetrahydrofolate cyclo-ligase n=1 Tax=Haloferula sp. BvORR071 TaxID=1396141 RepID=UPI002240F949|nr:5-formyltetrahydrofolate cyclo-ligase [Haloferula sp. BvORR071]